MREIKLGFSIREAGALADVFTVPPAFLQDFTVDVSASPELPGRHTH